MLLDQSLEDLVARLRAMEDVRRVSVFGSYARGRRDLFTDLDVLVVMETGMGLVDRLRFLYSKVNLPVDLDIICYTPQEFEALKGTAKLRSILQEEQVLYESKPP